jgi:hypothetical protein
LLQQEQLVLCIAVVGEFSKPASAYNGVCNSIPFVHLSCEYSLKINILALLLVCRAGAGSGANPSGIADDAVTKAREKLNEGKARFGDLFKGKVGSSSDIGDKASNLAGDAQNLANKAVSGAQDKVRF